MKNILLKLFYSFAISILLFACKNNDGSIVIPDNSMYMKITEASSTNSTYLVSMYTPDSIFVGYNKLFFKITNKKSGQIIQQASIVLHPLMDMVTTKHSCPVENPDSIVPVNNYYEGAIIFSMPGENSWSVGVDITVNGKTEAAMLNIPKVIATIPTQKIVVTDSVITAGILTQTKYPIAIVRPTAWKKGVNTFEITINTMQDMMTYPVCSDFTVEITPIMLTMGHSSPNNVNPVYVSNGHYVGKVNFTMSGDWRINMIIKKGDRIVSKFAYFDISF